MKLKAGAFGEVSLSPEVAAVLLLWGHRRSRRAVEGLGKGRELGEATNDAELARRMLVRHDGVERRLLAVNLTPRLCERDEEEPLLGLHARAQRQNFNIFVLLYQYSK